MAAVATVCSSERIRHLASMEGVPYDTEGLTLWAQNRLEEKEVITTSPKCITCRQWRAELLL